jgi:hypothetical protein
MASQRSTTHQESHLAELFLRIANIFNETATSVVAIEERLRQVELAITEGKQSSCESGNIELRKLQKHSVELEIRSHVNTTIAALWLNRTPQTLRKWACYEDGPIRPVKINGRLAWPVVEIKKLLSS